MAAAGAAGTRIAADTKGVVVIRGAAATSGRSPRQKRRKMEATPRIRTQAEGTEAVPTAAHRAVVVVRATGLGAALTGAGAVEAVGEEAISPPRALLPGDTIRLG